MSKHQPPTDNPKMPNSRGQTPFGRDELTTEKMRLGLGRGTTAQTNANCPTARNDRWAAPRSPHHATENERESEGGGHLRSVTVSLECKPGMLARASSNGRGALLQLLLPAACCLLLLLLLLLLLDYRR